MGARSHPFGRQELGRSPETNPVLEPAGTSLSGPRGTEETLLGTMGSSHSLDCFLFFEEPLDDFLGFFIRWYFRASSLSGAAASPDGDGRFLERKSRHAPSAAPGHARTVGRPRRGAVDPSQLCHGEGKGEKPGRRQHGQPGMLGTRCRRREAPHVCATVPSLVPPAQLRRKVQVRRGCSQHPAHLPATPALLHTKDGADPMSDKAFLGSGGKPLGMEREGETEKQHDSSETGAVCDKGRVTPAQQTGRWQGSCLAPAHVEKKKQGHTTDRDTKGTAGVSTSLPGPC